MLPLLRGARSDTSAAAPVRLRGSDAIPAPPGNPDPLANVLQGPSGFHSGSVVVAVHDLRVRGNIVVRQGGRGRIVGPAGSTGRLCVQFEWREDGSDNRLNCLPDELKPILAGGHQLGARVRAARQLETPCGRGVAAFAPGSIVGADPGVPYELLVVRFPVGGAGELVEVTCDADDVESEIAGNFRRGHAVIATRDLRVGGEVVVRDGVLGTVVGPSSSDAQHRVTVSFSHREDGSRNRLNCIVNEIRLYVAGGLEVGSRVQAVRTLAVDGSAPIRVGAQGVVLGPALHEPLSRLRVRFNAQWTEQGEAVGDSDHAAASAEGDRGGFECDCRIDDITLVIAGGFRRGDSVTAAKDLRVKGIVVVKHGVVGTVIGQSSTDPSGRVTVAFARREDGRCNNLNVVPSEIQRMPCMGGLVSGDRVAALRQLLVVDKGTNGTVIGPSCARSTRVAVRFDSGEDRGKEVVLHVESSDLRVLHAVGEDADDSFKLEDGEGGEELTEDAPRVVAGGYDRGDSVRASHDLCVGGHMVVRAGVYGVVCGPSGQDPNYRVTVAFAYREDGKTNSLNVVPSEIHQAEPRVIQKGELCAICLGELLGSGDDTTGDPEAQGGADTEGELAEDVCHMPCGHVLHAACVRAYLNHQSGSAGCSSTSGSGATPLARLRPAQCPVCRREMLP